MPRRGRVIPFPGRPAGRPAAEAREERGFVEICRCARAEAVVVKALLESEGIPVVFRSRIAHSVHPFTVGAQGEVVVLVPAHEAERGRRRLARVRPRPGASS